MPFPSESFLTQIQGAVLWVGDEFTALYSQLTAWLSVEHKDDGSHSDVHADSVTVIDGGDLTIEDEDGNESVFSRTVAQGLQLDLGITDAESEGHLEVIGRIGTSTYRTKIGVFAVTGAADGPGIGFNTNEPSPSELLRTWHLVHDNGHVTGSSLVFVDVTGGLDVLRLRRTSSSDVYELLPDATTRGTININVGSIQSGTGSEHFSNGYFLNLFGRTAIFERSRTTAIGVWIDVAFNAANFTANGAMTWTVASGDQNTYSYMLIGTTMVLTFKVSTTTVGGTPDTTLRIAIPGGFAVASGYTSSQPMAYYQGTWIQGWAEVASGEAYVRLFTTGFGSANWAASADGTYLQGQVIFEIA